MRMLLAVVVMGCVASSAGALAAEPEGSPASPGLRAGPCEHAGLVRALAKLPGSAALRVERGPERTALIDVASRTVVLEATCTSLRVPLADGLQPDARRAPAATRDDGRFTVSKTARGAVSLGIAAGLAASERIELLAFDDDSVSVVATRANERALVWYSAATRADGTLVEVEAAPAGCGCERTTTPDGRVSERPVR